MCCEALFQLAARMRSDERLSLDECPVALIWWRDRRRGVQILMDLKKMTPCDVSRTGLNVAMCLPNELTRRAPCFSYNLIKLPKHKEEYMMFKVICINNTYDGF